MSNVVAIAAGAAYSLALKADGTVWGWGTSPYVFGTYVARRTPVQFDSMDHVVAIAAGGDHAFAIKKNGSLWSWGDNIDGQVGNGTYIATIAPVQVIVNVVGVAGGYQFSLALKKDGTVWAWGSNCYGQLGDGIYGEHESSPTPIQVALP